MDQLISFTILGIVTGSIYAIAASGLVVTYVTSGIFNIAHGAIGMLMAFTYWELRVNQGWPAPVALIAVVFVIAPLLGAAIERTLIRPLRTAPVATSLVVTVALMVFMIGLAQAFWNQGQARALPGFFSPKAFELGGVQVTWHEAITILTAGAVALSLWLILTKTRLGVAMRAVVDDRNLASLTGARPDRVSMLSWAMGSSLASIAGILLAPQLGLIVIVLTLLVVNAYAAAMVGRLQSLPLTFAGAMILGLIEAYIIGFVDLGDRWQGLRPALPTLFLFAVLLLMPEARLRAGRIVRGLQPRAPSMQRSLVAAGALVAGIAMLGPFLDATWAQRVQVAFAFGLIMLSLVLLSGLAGQVSLCQMTFAGVGAFAMAQFGATGSPLGILIAIALASIVGALVALPALRLQGLYLALATMAFAVLMEYLVFPDPEVFGGLGSRDIGRLRLLGISFDSDEMYLVLLAVAFAACALLVQAIRRGTFGRVLTAMRDSPIACATLGLSLTRTKLAVFSLSAAIAGLGGALFGGIRENAGSTDFIMLQSLPVLLLAVVGGLTTVSGALLGGLALATIPVVENALDAIDGINFLLAGSAAVALGRNPNGLATLLGVEGLSKIRKRRARPPAPAQGTPKPQEVSEVAAAAG